MYTGTAMIAGVDEGFLSLQGHFRRAEKGLLQPA
jgi:hypothetical protein